MNLVSKRRIEQVRRRWWVVVVVTALGALIAAAASLATQPTYLGKSTMVLSGRTPDQDAVVVLGYVTLFNDPATISRLEDAAKIPAGVTFEARTAAASPILTVEATAGDPKTAQSAATNMATAFRTDVNAVQEAGISSHMEELQSELSQVDPLTPSGTANPYYTSLQERIDEVGGYLSNQLQVLQPQVGVTEIRPNILSNLLLGVVGGFLLGILAALGLAALSTRVKNADDLRDKAGVAPLVEVPAAGSAERQDRLRTLSNLVSLEELAKPAVIAITDGRGCREAREIAEALAKFSAQQGDRTVLVYADINPPQVPGDTGFTEALTDSSLARATLKPGDVGSLKILPAGSTVADRFSLVTRERIAEVLNELRKDADTIIVVASSIAETIDAQLICAAADLTILAVTVGSRAGDVTSAAETLEKAHATPWTAVLVDRTTHGKRRLGSTPGVPTTPPTGQPEIPFAEYRPHPNGNRATQPIS